MLLFSQRTNITSIITRSFQKRKNMTCNLESDGCPNLLCQREESVLAEVAVEKELETVLKLWLARKSSRELEECWWVLPYCNRYKPSFACPIPIVLQQVRSWIKQKVDRKIRQQGWDLVMVLTKRRLKVKEGTHKTLWIVSEEERLTVPICVTEAVSPLGNSTIDWAIAVIEDKRFIEQTMWSVAPVSITQISEV